MNVRTSRRLVGGSCLSIYQDKVVSPKAQHGEHGDGSSARYVLRSPSVWLPGVSSGSVIAIHRLHPTWLGRGPDHPGDPSPAERINLEEPKEGLT